MAVPTAGTVISGIVKQRQTQTAGTKGHAMAAKRYVSALTIAGSDPSGGAGIQADLKTFSALGVYGASAVTAVTVQNTVEVKYVHSLPPEAVYDQIAAVMEDIRPDAVKIGMVNDAGTLDAIVRALETYRPRHVVVDPVMVSTSGCALMQADALRTMKERLLPLADIVTPNLPEAFALADNADVGYGERTGRNIDTTAAAILRLGVKALLIKGGHAEGRTKTDYLYLNPNAGEHMTDCISGHMELSADTVDTVNTHGTGCTLSSAITAFLARGLGLEQAVRSAKRYLTSALEAGADIAVGKGHGPVNHFFRSDGRPQCLLTRLTDEIMNASRVQFITHSTGRYSWYDSAKLALEGGCKWIQLRMKDADETEIERTARRILPECRHMGAVFIIDDNVDVALRTGADGVHLGKNDMPVKEARRIAGERLIIGGTANTAEDICRLAEEGADYIGCGPFRFTTTKKNLAPVLGTEGYRKLTGMMKDRGISLPIVAIGGITYGDIGEIMKTGVTGIALSGSILRADDPVAEMKRVMESF